MRVTTSEIASKDTDNNMTDEPDPDDDAAQPGLPFGPVILAAGRGSTSLLVPAGNNNSDETFRI